MANTFKLKTKANVSTIATIYTVPSSTTAIVIGLMVGNVQSSSITVTVHIESDTSDTETNQNVELVTNAPIPAGSSLELLSGNKVVLQTTDVLMLTASAGCDIAVSILDIT